MTIQTNPPRERPARIDVFAPAAAVLDTEAQREHRRRLAKARDVATAGIAYWEAWPASCRPLFVEILDICHAHLFRTAPPEITEAASQAARYLLFAANQIRFLEGYGNDA